MARRHGVVRSRPDRFPSVLSRDLRKEQGKYEDRDDPFAMYLHHKFAKSVVQVNEQTRLLEIARTRTPSGYVEAARSAAEAASSDSGDYGSRVNFRLKGTRIRDEPTN